MSGPVHRGDAPSDAAEARHPATRASRSPTATRPSSASSSYAGRCRAVAGAPSAPGASPTTWARRTSPRTAASTSARTRTSACRPSPGSSTARCCTATASAPSSSIRPGQLNLMTAGQRRVATPRRRPAATAARSHGSSCGSRSPRRPATAPPAFEHHAELPQVELDGGVGRPCSSATLAGVRVARPAHDTPLVGRRPRAARRAADGAAAARTSSTPSSCSTARSPSTASRSAPGGSPTSAAAATSCALDAGEPTPGAAARRRAVRRADPHVVELRRPHPRGDRRRVRARGGPDDGRFGAVASPLDRIPAKPPWWAGQPMSTSRARSAEHGDHVATEPADGVQCLVVLKGPAASVNAG